VEQELAVCAHDPLAEEIVLLYQPLSFRSQARALLLIQLFIETLVDRCRSPLDLRWTIAVTV
jgi:hypothetical protein